MHIFPSKNLCIFFLKNRPLFASKPSFSFFFIMRSLKVLTKTQAKMLFCIIMLRFRFFKYFFCRYNLHKISGMIATPKLESIFGQNKGHFQAK